MGRHTVAMEQKRPLAVETERLRLRSWREDDLDAFARITADPEVMRYMLRGPLRREEAQARIERFEHQRRERGLGHWAVEERESGALLGGIGLFHHEDWPEDPNNVEVGWLLDRSAWGRGLATEGAQDSNLESPVLETGAFGAALFTHPGQASARTRPEWRRWPAAIGFAGAPASPGDAAPLERSPSPSPEPPGGRALRLNRLAV